ncbi:hypothetical protein HDU76_002172 [Blyttiomyces sp. JEL0837]|nr:hypothetical protein HDU76_002172 [Blyttiomyces sp. JEL0837]
MPSSSSSLWDSVPQEIKEDVFGFCDPLTLYINGLLPLSDTHKDRYKATEVWNVVLEMGWEGDLTLLPTFGFPTVFNGLCKVTARDLYERLCILRPDLDHRVAGVAKDMIDIFVINDPAYGKINFPINPEIAAPRTARPIKLQDDADNIRCGRSTSTLTPVKIRTGFEHYLINIPLRMCWMDIIEGYLLQNPRDIAIYAIAMNHFDLLKYLVEMKLVDVKELSSPGADLINFKPYAEVARHGNLDMIKYLRENGCHFNELRSVLHEIIRFDSSEYLEYFKHELLGNGLGSMFESGNPDNMRTWRWHVLLSGYTTNMSTWEWHWDLILKFDRTSSLVPIPTDKESAERIINKLGKGYDIRWETFSALANRDRKDLFQILWNHQSSTGRPNYRILGPNRVLQIDPTITDIETIMQKFISVVHHLGIYGYPSPNAIRLSHRNGNTPENCSTNELINIVLFKHEDHDIVDILRTCYQVCKCPSNVNFTSRVMDMYITHGGNDINIIKFLHKHCVRYGNAYGAKDSPLSLAAGFGYFEVVKYLCENATNENGWIWSEVDMSFAMDCAIRRGTPEVVKYLHDIQHVPFPDEMALIAAKSERLDMIKHIHENIPEAVFTPAVTDEAARLGNLSTVRYLCQNRKEGCTKNVVMRALATGGHQGIWLKIAEFVMDQHPEFDYSELNTPHCGDVIKQKLERLMVRDSDGGL